MLDFHCPHCGQQEMIQLSADHHYVCLHCLSIHALQRIGTAGQLITDQEATLFVEPMTTEEARQFVRLASDDKGVTL